MPESRSPALSMRLDLARMGEDPREALVEADEAARAAIAADFGLPAVSALSGRFRLAPAGDGRVEVQLDLAARVTQTCVVSLAPVEQTVTERASLVLLTAAAAKARGEATAIDPDAPDEIVAEGTVVDLGAILVEQLALALDPYPRQPDAEPPVSTDSTEEKTPHPFAALAQLRRPR